MRIRALVALCLVLGLPASPARAASPGQGQADLVFLGTLAPADGGAIRAQEETPSPDGSVAPDDPATEGSRGGWSYLAAGVLLALWLWLTMRRARRLR
jgi:hypothetical protein